MAAELTEPTLIANSLFAWNINNLVIEGAHPNEEVTLFIYTDGLEIDDTRYCDTSGNCTINLSPYLQAMFSPDNGVEVNGQTAFSTELTIIIVVDTSDISATLRYNVIFGAINPTDELFPDTITTHWWYNMPQTYSFIRRYAGTLYLLDEDGNTLDEGTSNSNLGIDTITLADYMYYDSEMAAGFLDQYTRSGSTVRIRKYHYFTPHSETDGLFLRWLDTLGRWQYFMFCKGDDSYATSNYGGSLITEYTGAYVDYYGTRYQGKSAARSVNACAQYCDEDTYKLLTGLSSSPNVCLYDTDNSLWIPVQISGGTNTWQRDQHKQLQDYEITIVMPDIITQKL